jgi:hypothetical protein
MQQCRHDCFASEQVDHLDVFREPTGTLGGLPNLDSPHRRIGRGAASADTDVESSAARVIDGLGLLCEQRRMSRGDRTD